MSAKEAEEKILAFWKDAKIYEKSREQNATGKKFYFMDGPPYASGHIHMGTALNKILKDIAMRVRRLQGYDVFDRPGYDTHGVPIELQIEKEIGSKSKNDIETFGVKKFVDRCKEFATQYIDVMNDEFANLGVWMDWSDPYLTLSDEYIEAIWSAFKKADEKNLLYLGAYPVHICPRCETAVAYNEIEYGKQKDTSVFVKFPLKDKDNRFLIIWTTTPWTLPANTGVMVHPDVTYQEVEVMEGEHWIIAKDLVPTLMARIERGFTVKAEYLGKEMEGWRYENPLAKHLKLDLENAYRVVLSARYVTTEEGTGLVHTAPGHGKEDYEVGKETGLPMPCPVSTSGHMTSEAGKYAGKRAREVDAEILSDLEQDNALVYKLEYEHDYPLCWRDKTPLLMVSLPQWFLKISEIHNDLLAQNGETKWVPDYMQLRMKAWLSGIGDWPVSRQRYWGTPLPIWRDVESGEKMVVGSIAELAELSGKEITDVHKPGIDEIVIEKNGKTFRRVPEVLDVWFDSGVSSWAALRYPKQKELFEKFWPADLNIEGKDQFRGWWNSQIILSQIMFDRKPFDNIAVHGMVLDISKTKMSKSQGNNVSPKDIIDKYGRDYIRYYFAQSSKGEDLAFNEHAFKDIQSVFRVFANVNRFIDQLSSEGAGTEAIEDRWILSKFHSAVQSITQSYEGYKFYEAVQRLEDFLVRDLSRTYIQIIRDRADDAAPVLREIRAGLLKLFAPIVPFMAESTWLSMKEHGFVNEESVFLSGWPVTDTQKIDEDLETQFGVALQVIEKGLSERDTHKVGLRWPLPGVIATIPNMSVFPDELKDIIARQLNVKDVAIQKSNDTPVRVVLDTVMSPELEAEGFAREIARKVQAERKKRGLKKEDTIDLHLLVDSDLSTRLAPHLASLQQRTGAKTLNILDKKTEAMVLFIARDEEIGIDFS